MISTTTILKICFIKNTEKNTTIDAQIPPTLTKNIVSTLKFNHFLSTNLLASTPSPPPPPPPSPLGKCGEFS